MENYIDIYEKIKLLNEGGFGSVYLSMNVHTKEIVALKLLNPELLLREGFRERFHEEALILRQMPRHEHIVQLLDYGEAHQQPYLVMEYLPGRDLRDLIDQGPLPVRQAALIGCQVAEALQAAAEHGLVHCDVKPENIRISEGTPTETLRVRLMDFGIARVLGADLRDIAGTVTYMAPELWRGEQPEPAADIYALGCVLYEMLTGRPPVYLSTQSDPQTTRQALMRLHIYGLADWSPFQDIRELEPFVALLQKMLDKQAGVRPSAKEVCKTLQRLFVQLPGDVTLRPVWTSKLAIDPERTRTRVPGDIPVNPQSILVESVEPVMPKPVEKDLLAPVQALDQNAVQPSEVTLPKPPTGSGIRVHFLRSQASCDLGEMVCRAGLLVDRIFYTGTQDGEILRKDLESARLSRWKIPGLRAVSHNWSFLAYQGTIIFHTGGTDWCQVDGESGRLINSGVLPEAGLRFTAHGDQLWLSGARSIIYLASLSDLSTCVSYPLETRAMGLPCFWNDRLLVPTRKGVYLLNPATRATQRVGPGAAARSVHVWTLPGSRQDYMLAMYSMLNPEGIQHNVIHLIKLDDVHFSTVDEVNIAGQPAGGLQRSGNYFGLVCSDGQMWCWRVQAGDPPRLSRVWNESLGAGVQVRGEGLVKDGLCLAAVGGPQGERLVVRNAATGSILVTQNLSGETFLAPFMMDQMVVLLMASGQLDVFRILYNT